MQLEDYFDDTIEELILIVATSEVDEYQDSIRYLPIT
jgi:hypothetical protein